MDTSVPPDQKAPATLHCEMLQVLFLAFHPKILIDSEANVYLIYLAKLV